MERRRAKVQHDTAVKEERTAWKALNEAETHQRAALQEFWEQAAKRLAKASECNRRSTIRTESVERNCGPGLRCAGQIVRCARRTRLSNRGLRRRFQSRDSAFRLDAAGAYYGSPTALANHSHRLVGRLSLNRAASAMGDVRFSDRARLSTGVCLSLVVIAGISSGCGSRFSTQSNSASAGAARIGQTEGRATLLGALLCAADIHGFIRTIVHTRRITLATAIQNERDGASVAWESLLSSTPAKHGAV